MLTSLKNLFFSKKEDNPFEQKALNQGIRNYLTTTEAKWNPLFYTNNYIELVNTIPELRTVLNYLSKLFGSIDFDLYEVDADGEEVTEIENHRILDILENPNYLMNSSEFFTQLYFHWKLFGNAYLFRALPLGFESVSYETYLQNIVNLWNIPSYIVTYDLKDNITAQDVLFARDKSEITKGFYLNFNGKKTALNINDIFHFNDIGLTFDKNLVKGSSITQSLKYPLSNLEASYEARNTILRKRGALGILSNKTQSAIGTTPLKQGEKDKIQKQFSEQYGLSSDMWQIIITDADLNWQQMGLPIQELQLLEGNDKDKSTIMDAFGLPMDLLASVRGSTYENQKQAEKRVYQNVVIPDWKVLELSLNKLFKTKENNLYLEICTDDIEALEQDKTKENQYNKMITDEILALNKSVMAGETSVMQARTVLQTIWDIDIDTIDLLYPL